VSNGNHEVKIISHLEAIAYFKLDDAEESYEPSKVLRQGLDNWDAPNIC
jgi:hypothetical protein